MGLDLEHRIGNRVPVDRLVDATERLNKPTGELASLRDVRRCAVEVPVAVGFQVLDSMLVHMFEYNIVTLVERCVHRPQDLMHRYLRLPW
ncbi:hypothetical protein [Sorangium sp. So ce426]|uniref:hypothetical protein n=1 Tax=unclassified Sorangium TaxID=2621164 RepID=UPI003F5BAA8B